MNNQPNPTQTDNSAESEVIKLGIVNLPKNQLFPIMLVLIILTGGIGIVIATSDSFRLAGIISIIIGLGWASLIYQNIQNKRQAFYDNIERTEMQTFDITITVLSPENLPVKGASVTVQGPVAITDRKTNRDGRIIYEYSGLDADNYRNREITIFASYNEMNAYTSSLLHSQEGQFIDLKLSRTAQNEANIDRVMDSKNTIIPIDTNLYQRIVDTVTPHVSNHSNRGVLLNRAFFNQSIVDAIDTSGAASVFSANLILELYKNGGNEMIITFLETLKQGLGIDRQAEIDSLINDIQK